MHISVLYTFLTIYHSYPDRLKWVESISFSWRQLWNVDLTFFSNYSLSRLFFQKKCNCFWSFYIYDFPQAWSRKIIYFSEIFFVISKSSQVVGCSCDIWFEFFVKRTMPFISFNWFDDLMIDLKSLNQFENKILISFDLFLKISL